MARTKQRAFTGFGISLIGLFAFAVFMNLNFKTVIVEGRSMYPTLEPNERVVLTKAYWLVGSIRDRDIVVIQDPEGDGFIIKRVYRMGGETVPLENRPPTSDLNEGEYVVPPGTVFVLGDNLTQSEDSRVFGPVPLNRIVGKVVVRP